MWTGIVSRKYAEYVMRMPAVLGGFVATDIVRYDNDGRVLNGFFAAIPDSMTPPSTTEGRAVPRDQFRAAMVRENSCIYLGSDEDHADAQGFALPSRIQHLLDRLGDGE
jgi:hypothetical protein